MLKLKDKSISAFKGDYRPLELFKNAKKLHGFSNVGITGEQKSFKNTYNDYLTVYGKSGHIKGTNLMPPPESCKIKEVNCEYQVVLKENGTFDFKGVMVTGKKLTSIKLCAGTYTVSGCEYIHLWWEGQNGFLPLPATFTITKDTEVMAYFWYTGTTELVLTNQYIQIEEGETVNEYTPYMGNLQFPKSPNNVHPIISAGGNIRCEGGNITPPDFCDITSWDTVYSSDGAARKIKKLDLLPGKYVFTFNHQPLTTYIFLYLQRIDAEGKEETIGRPVMNYDVNNRITFEVSEAYTYRLWSWRFIENISLFSDFVIRRTDTPDDCYKIEPIIEAEISNLRGIEVTAEDNYNYSEVTESEEKYYISDCLKGNLLTRFVGEKVFTGEESIVQIEGQNQNYNTFVIDLSDCFETNKNYSPVICNFLNCLNSQNADTEGVILGKNDKNLYFNLEKSKFATVSDLSSWLKSRYDGDNPLRLLYLLEEPLILQTDAEKTLKSYPKFTRVMVKMENPQMPLGVSKIIKVQD